MHIAVCDDNTDELSRISSLLEDYQRDKNPTITYEAFHSAVELLEIMQRRQFDLLFLDILMPGISGMEAAKEIRRTDSELPIIFLTSSREFAVESYRVHAKDYIIKPAHREEIFPVLDKLLTIFTQKETYLTLKTGSGIIKLPFSQIVSVEVINRTVQFLLVNGDRREAYGYLADYEDNLLSDPHFFKPHRSYVVNLRHVTELEKKGFLTILGNLIPVARDTFPKAKAAYMKHLLLADEWGDA